MARAVKQCHRLVMETAEEMGHVLYDHMMQDNVWYSIWRQQNPGLTPAKLEHRFVRKNLAILIPQARATLAALLGRPGLDDKQKEEIHEALVLDNRFVEGRKKPLYMNN